MSKSKTNPTTLATVERRRLIFDLRKGGATYAQIVATLRGQFGPDALPKGYDERDAHKDVTRELARLRQGTALDAVDVVTMELERLNALFLGIWTRATGGDLPAIDRALAIMRRMAELQGVVTPIAIDWQIEVIHLLQAGTVTPAMVVEELGSDLARELFERAGIKTITSTATYPAPQSDAEE